MAKNESYALLGKVMVALTRVEAESLGLVLDVVQKLINPSDRFLEDLKKVLRGEQIEEEKVKEEMIVRRIRVDRTLTPQQALSACCHVQYCDDSVVTHMPWGEGEEVELVFFKGGRFLSDAGLEQKYASRGLRPADPYSLAAFNAANPAFADKVPHGTHWQDTSGRWCFAAWHRRFGEREVLVLRRVSGWGAYWWYAGICSK